MSVSFRFLLRPALLTALLLPGTAMAEDSAISMSAAVQKLARQGAELVVQMDRRDDRYVAVVRRDDGSHAAIAVDPATGRLSAAEERDLLSNSLDTQFVTQWLRVFTDDVAPQVRPAHDVVRGLMASGQYSDLDSLKLDGKVYKVVMRDKTGALVDLDVDGETASVAQKPGV